MDDPPPITSKLYIYNANKRFFYQVIAALAYELKELGYNPICVEAIPEPAPDKQDTIIVFGYQDVSGKIQKITKLRQFNLVVYNTEQLTNKNSLIRDLVNVDHVWDYSFQNIELLKNTSKYHVPLGYSPAFCTPDIKPDRADTTLNFFGTINDRRRAKIKQINEAGIPFRKNDNAFHHRWDALVRAEKCYVNIHYFPKPVLEVFRIVPLLSNECCVFSERSGDHRLDEMYKPFITFFDTIDELKGVLVNDKAVAFKERKFGDFITKSGCLKCLAPRDPLL